MLVVKEKLKVLTALFGNLQIHNKRTPNGVHLLVS